MDTSNKNKKNIKRREFIKTSATATVGLAILLPKFGPFSNLPDKTDMYYNTLAESLNKLPNAFPRTKSNVEKLLLKKIFSPEEAWFAGQLTIERESIETIAKRVGLPVEEAKKRLETMSRRGFVQGSESGGYRLAPFIVGIYEAQLWNMDHELAHLTEEWLDEGGAEFMRPQPAIHRVIPAQSSVKSEWILPYDDVKAVLKTKKSFRVRDCICRVQQGHIGERKCDFPLHVCLNFSSSERPPSDRDISMEEALALIDETEEVGLVHSVTDIAEGFGYVCNCCGCCCAILRGITEWGIEKSIAAANYYSVIDPNKCIGCGTCLDRCHMGAISEQDGIAIVNREKCIGCGLCVTGCPNDVAELELKTDDEIINPPKDFATWEQERLVNRGLVSK